MVVADVKAEHVAPPFISRDRFLLLKQSYQYPVCSTVRPGKIRIHGQYALYSVDIEMLPFNVLMHFVSL